MNAKNTNMFILMLIAVTLAYFSLKVYNRKTHLFYKEATGNMSMMATSEATSAIRNVSVKDAMHRTLATNDISTKDAIHQALASKDIFTKATLNWATSLKNSEPHQYDNTCQSCEKVLPDVIIQYGFSRTASTLQFHILCLVMIILHENEVKNVGCAFEKRPDTKYSVIKTHVILQNFQLLSQNAWVFMTLGNVTKQTSNLLIKDMKKKNITIRYVADIDLVLKRGYFIVHEYQQMFELTNEQMVYVTEYIRYWDILRLCCGTQMSSQWRNVLFKGANYNHQTNKEGLSYPACEMYNISQVEKMLINTYIYKQFAHVDSVSEIIGRTSDVDRKLNGNYCERCNANIAKYHLSFNEPCV